EEIVDDRNADRLEQILGAEGQYATHRQVIDARGSTVRLNGVIHADSLGTVRPSPHIENDFILSLTRAVGWCFKTESWIVVANRDDGVTEYFTDCAFGGVGEDNAEGLAAFGNAVIQNRNLNQLKMFARGKGQSACNWSVVCTRSSGHGFGEEIDVN